MTDDQHGEGTPRAGGRWDPLPQGEYDDGATAFVQLPEGGLDGLPSSSDTPLAAPGGHGYVPPQITVAPATTAGTDPAATGTWAVPGAPVDGAGWNAPGAGQEQQDPHTAPQAGHDRYGYRPGDTGQWSFDEASAGEGRDGGPDPAAGQDVTGQWSIPVARGDIPDESGEFTTSSLVEQWGGTPPATLPGGAPAPWAPPPEAIGRPWGPGVPGVPQDDGPDGPPHGHGPDDGPGGRPAHDGSGHPPHAYTPGAGTAPAGEPGRPDTAAERPSPEHTRPAAHGTGEPEDGHRRADGAPEGAADAGTDPRGPADGAGHPAPAQDPDPAGRTDAPGPRDGDAPRADADGDTSGEQPEAVADATAPDATAPDATAPDATAPDATAPDATAPDATAPDATAPDTTAPDATAPDGGPPPGGPHDDHPLASYVLRVNGTDRPVTDAWIGESLLYVLRERLGLAGAKDGCSQGECGACNVQVDGRLVASCLVPAVTAAGSEVRTVEGLAQDGRPSDVQRALARCGAVQCGFCVPGMAMTVHDLLEGNPAPTELETRQALCGNLCRCSGYRGVVDAVRQVVAEREAHAAPDDTGQDTGPSADEARIPHQAGPGDGGVNPPAHPAAGPDDQPHGQDGGQA
ncbi:2Fe-2S iron-sulfur cluster-binding protein [Streptomyces sp. enrichment culture]|uniref:(2Fe-2S)-binding protein n=1 Tax=Streptomyces sp. enrichment culture TaxID=1795815 RepID=UPI003F57F1A7